MTRSKITKEEYDNIKDEVETYELGYCLVSDDFYYSGPYTRKIVGNKVYFKAFDEVYEDTLDKLSCVAGIDELTDANAYFFEDTLEVNDESISKFITNIKNYIKKSLETDDIKKCIEHFNNLDKKISNFKDTLYESH